jgi:hypothetical protein
MFGEIKWDFEFARNEDEESSSEDDSNDSYGSD